MLWGQFGGEEEPRKFHQDWIKAYLEQAANGERTLSDETRQIYEMVIPLENLEDNQYTSFTCKNFDTKSGNCQVYDSRPEMCRAYPEKACNYEGCTLVPAHQPLRMPGAEIPNPLARE